VERTYAMSKYVLGLTDFYPPDITLDIHYVFIEPFQLSSKTVRNYK